MCLELLHTWSNAKYKVRRPIVISSESNSLKSGNLVFTQRACMHECELHSHKTDRAKNLPNTCEIIYFCGRDYYEIFIEHLPGNIRKH
ncbi:hypothetical protein YC2023_090380 [Brassica napus]